MLFLPAVLQRTLVFLALSAMTLAAWGYLLRENHGVSMMPGHHAHMAGGPEPWSLPGFLLGLAMWAVMMLGMMTPSVVPVILGILRTGIRTTLPHPYRRTLAFLLGYFLVWLLYCAAAAAAQCELRACDWLSPSLESQSVLLSAGVLILAGLYQLTPWKSVCLGHCRNSNAAREPCHRNPIGLGLHHGVNCVGSCWALMGIMFAVGIMNLSWMAILGLIAILEKTLPLRSVWLRCISGIPLLLWGGWLLAAVWQ